MSGTAWGSTLQVKHKPFNHMTQQEKVHFLKRQIYHDHSIIRFAKNHPSIQTTELNHAVRWAHISLRVASKNLKRLIYPPRASGNVSGLLCIHRYEGAWGDPNPPYWGGLQMDMNFQLAYGREFYNRWGTADHWPVWAQLQAGLRGVAARGYSPWPNTARLCGLL